MFYEKFLLGFLIWWVMTVLSEIKLQTKYQRELTTLEATVCAVLMLIPAVIAADTFIK